MTHHEAVEADFRHNMLIFVLLEFIWGFGIAFAAYNTMVPGYLAALGAPKAIIGLIQALPIVLTPLQFLSASVAASEKRKSVYITITLLGCLCYVGFAIISIFFIPADSLTLLIVGFSLSTGLFMTTIMICNPILFGLITDNAPMKMRGRFFGYRVSALGVSTVSMGFLAGFLLKRVVFPLNYQVSFLIGGSFYICAVLIVFLAKDHADPTVQRVAPKRPVYQLLKQTKKAWTNPNYRMLIFFHLLNMSAIILAPFVIPFGVTQMGVTPDQISILTMLYFAGSGIGGVLVGRIADSFGYKSVMIVQSICLAVFFVIVINAESFPVVAAAYALLAIPSIVANMVLTNFSVEIFPGTAVGTLTIMGNLLILPVVGVLAPVGGALIDRGAPYSSVFLVGLVLSLVALGGIITLVKEPRKGRLYVVKRIPRR